MMRACGSLTIEIKGVETELELGKSGNNMRSSHVVCRYFLGSTHGDPEYSRSVLVASMVSLLLLGMSLVVITIWMGDPACVKVGTSQPFQLIKSQNLPNKPS